MEKIKIPNSNDKTLYVYLKKRNRFLLSVEISKNKYNYPYFKQITKLKFSYITYMVKS
ncbi:hypothetical protein EV142_101209 [Flavobacterium circumlabens]|uniref:Uncharacterized protein n=1 Tax=Flavobacterium circumlabens TaxID=2133765 RepID=A0ABY2B469_9FLAO|nr:hypothetical protein EV142_101209 [Flavobacterium circumlabens]